MVKYIGTGIVNAADFIDLHTHTTASDGRHEPADLVNLLATFGIKLLALTDHETMFAFNKLTGSCLPSDFTVVHGIEFTTHFVPVTNSPSISANVDILVYGLDYFDPKTSNLLAETEIRNNYRMQEVCEKLADLGVPISINDLLAVRKPNSSLHIGLIVEHLLKSGYLDFQEQNIANFVNNIVGHKVLSTVLPTINTDELIALAKELGAVPIVAHPGQCPEYIQEHLTSINADGFEIEHPANSHEIKAKFIHHCTKNNLLITGGTDFHGWFSPNYPFNPVLTANFVFNFLKKLDIEVLYE